jgi:hypothetical protein
LVLSLVEQKVGPKVVWLAAQRVALSVPTSAGQSVELTDAPRVASMVDRLG